MDKKIINLVCRKCDKITTFEENIKKMRCFFCGSKSVETGWEFVSQNQKGVKL